LAIVLPIHELDHERAGSSFRGIVKNHDMTLFRESLCERKKKKNMVRFKNLLC